MISLALLVIFLIASLVYGRASKDMQRLDKMRLEREPPDAPAAILGAATEFLNKMGLPMAAGGDELQAFCNRSGLGDEYRRTNRRLLGAIVVAVLCIAAILAIARYSAPV